MSTEQTVRTVPVAGEVPDYDLPVSVVRPEKQSPVEARISALQQACDALIFSEENDNFLFVTQYGGTVTQEKFESDNRTDFDLRLVCFTLPSPAEQKHIRTQLQNVAGSMSVELYFHSYEKYVKGEVGETGSVSVLEAIQKGLDPEKTVTTLEHPSMVSLYTFATMRFFSQREADLEQHIKDLAKKQTSLSSDEVAGCTFEALQPDVLLESIQLDKEGMIEWIHLYLKSFLKDYHEFKQLLESEKNTPVSLLSYLKRLSKYLLRIAFGVTVMDADLAQIKAEYLRDIRGGVPADQIHFDMCATHSRNWYNASVREVFSAAVAVREYGDREGVANASVPLLKQSLQEMENQLLFLSQQAGGLLRREKFQEVHDFLTELAITNLLAPESADEESEFGSRYKFFMKDETIISQDDDSQDLLVISRKKRDGTENGTYSVQKNGEKISLKRPKTIVGELASLLRSKRTSALHAESEVEVITVDGSRFADLWQQKMFSGKQDEPLLRYFLRSYFNTEAVTTEQRNAFLLSFSLLNYFSSEFIQYEYENLDFGRVFSAEDKQDHILSEYHLSFFSEAVTDLLSRKKVPHFVETVPEDRAPELLFQAGEVVEDLFVVAQAGETGGVELTFANGDQTVLKKNQIVGESALLVGNKPALYSARVLPGTTMYRISAKDFLSATSTTDTLFAKVPKEDEVGKYTYEEVTAIELFFEVGIQCLDRLASGEQAS